MQARTAERPPAAQDPREAEAGGRIAAVASLGFVPDHPFLTWWGVALLVAIITALVWPTVPSYDPFSWVVWGREVTDPHISFFVGGGPSWKPLPFLFTTVYGVFGAVAPTLWVITARTGGIAGLIAAVRLASLLCRRAGFPAWAGAVAGLVAVVGIVLTAPSSGWTYYFFRGTSEPLLIGVWLWAVDAMVRGRHLQAYTLLAAEGLMRPEAWPFLLVYGAWLFWRVPGMRPWVIAGLVLQPAGWFVPPWISTGQPFLAASHAASYNGHLGSDPFATVVGRGEQLQPLPSLVLGVAAVLVALWRGRAQLPALRTRATAWLAEPSELPLVLVLAAATVAWWVIVVAMTLDGYPGLERFYLPAAALTCVLSGYGLVALAALAGDAASALMRRPAVRLGVACAAGLVLLAGSTHFLSARWAYARAQEPLAAQAVTRIDELGTAVARLGGRGAILPCGSSVVTINHSLQTALAWKLGTTLERVQTVLLKPGIAFVAPHDSIDGGVPPIDPKLSVHRLIGRVGEIQLFEVYAPGPRPRCLGR